jgi:hypothetical protein
MCRLCYTVVGVMLMVVVMMVAVVVCLLTTSACAATCGNSQARPLPQLLHSSWTSAHPHILTSLFFSPPNATLHSFPDSAVKTRR